MFLLVISPASTSEFNKTHQVVGVLTRCEEPFGFVEGQLGAEPRMQGQTTRQKGGATGTAGGQHVVLLQGDSWLFFNQKRNCLFKQMIPTSENGTKRSHKISQDGTNQQVTVVPKYQSFFVIFVKGRCLHLL